MQHAFSGENRPMLRKNPFLTTVRSVAIAAAAMFIIMVIPCLASEVAVLKNGFTITHERREVVGEVTRLYVNTDGASFVDVPTAQIDHFEAAPPPPRPSSTSSANPGIRNPSSSNPAFARNAKGAAPASGLPQGFPARPQADLNQVVNEASDRYRLDPDLVNSVIKAESGFNVRAVSPKGAQGLMQLMPGTAAQLGVPNTFDAQQNVEGGTRYLRELLERYNFDLVKALAAYNAGPQRVEQFGGVPPYYETRAYVARIVRDFNKKKTAQGQVAVASSAQKASVAKRASQKPSGKTQASSSHSRSNNSVAQASSNSTTVGMSAQK
jgi:Transglycosylase SLT domain